MKKIAVINYEMGNVNSVIGAVEKLGHVPVFSRDYTELLACDSIILPGVGAFKDGIKNLKKYDLDKKIGELVFDKKKPLLGICLGMQLLATTSKEFGEHEGLGWIEGEVDKLLDNADFKIPHIGWNEIMLEKENPLFKNIKNRLFYFVHSYHFKVKNSAHSLARCTYSEEFISVVKNQNIFGVQFHPEKSQAEGLILIKNFIENGQQC